jgi:hypothetical protein
MCLPERFFVGRSGSKQTCLCYILYVEQWRFRCNMSSGHRERGFQQPRLMPSFRHGLHGALGMIFLCTCGLCCCMLYVYYMLYVCYMSSSETSSGSSGSVWLYRRVIFGQQNLLCARTPYIMYRRTIFGKQNWSCARTPCTLIDV